MLVLKRKTNEAITIITPGGETIRVLVVSFERHNGAVNSVRLGFEGPRTVVIDREEVAEAKALARSA